MFKKFLIMFVCLIFIQSLLANGNELEIFIDKLYLKQKNMEEKNELYNNREFNDLKAFLKSKSNYLFSYLENVPVDETDLLKATICAIALKTSLGNERYSNLVDKIIKGTLDNKIKKIFYFINSTFLAFNYPTEWAQKQLNEIIKICDNESEREKYIAILNGNYLFYNIDLYTTGAWNEIAGIDAGKSFEDNFSKEMEFLSKDSDNIRITWFAISFSQLKSFLDNSNEFSINIDDISFSSCKKSDFKLFLDKNKNLDYIKDMDRESHLKKFIQLSLFAISEVKKKRIVKKIHIQKQNIGLTA